MSWHTKEPWIINTSGGMTYIESEVDGRSICRVSTSIHDARRIVACVNWCADLGMTTEELEVTTGREELRERDREIAKLREHLAAAEKAANDQSLLAEQYRIDAEASEAKLNELETLPKFTEVPIGRCKQCGYSEPVPAGAQDCISCQEREHMGQPATGIYLIEHQNKVAGLTRELTEQAALFNAVLTPRETSIAKLREHFLAQARNEAVPDGWQVVPKELLDEFPEINPANYGDDEVMRLNQWGIDVVRAAAQKPDGDALPCA